MMNNMKSLMVCSLCLAAALVGAGCTTNAKAKSQARAAFRAGQQQAAASEVREHSVWVLGNVKTPLIPWTDDLTLRKALLAAEYQGKGDPGQITIRRKGQSPINIDPKSLLQGEDVPLQAGDQVEITP